MYLDLYPKKSWVRRNSWKRKNLKSLKDRGWTLTKVTLRPSWKTTTALLFHWNQATGKVRKEVSRNR